MLVAVLILFIVFSFTSVADLSVSLASNSGSMESARNIKQQYEMESSINEALWRINSGADELVNLKADGVTIAWDSEKYLLSIGTENRQRESEIQLDLTESTPFSSAIASRTPIQTNGYFADVEEEHPVQQVDLIPTVDPAYFIINRAFIHHGDQTTWSKKDLQIEGIHIFLGNSVEISGLDLENSTLLFLGDDITFRGSNTIKAPAPVDSLPAVPAVVFMNPHTKFTLRYGTHVEGAVFCAGHLDIENAALTGPVLANSVTLTGNVDFRDDLHSDYYRWNMGFGNQHDYDWPKHVGRWRSVKWNKPIS
ncbi:MAG: hypothetical protein H8E26_10210 [FCB group bacterium]|nr:hypothetical protein [FCB group bacterium]MBL7120968.1 hypothetical protein [Candidatus Neomarinimicrobiota bacterium]